MKFLLRNEHLCQLNSQELERSPRNRFRVLVGCQEEMPSTAPFMT